MSTPEYDYEFLLDTVYNCFNYNTNDTNYVWQHIYFSFLCRKTFYGVGFLSDEKINTFKEEYLSWQDKAVPSISSWIDEKALRGECVIKAFSHSDDISWDRLDAPILSYILSETIEVGCNQKRN